MAQTYGGEDYDYREWMIKRIEVFTGHLYDIGNLHAETLEKLYERIVGKAPSTQYRIERSEDKE